MWNGMNDASKSFVYRIFGEFDPSKQVKHKKYNIVNLFINTNPFIYGLLFINGCIYTLNL